MTRILGAALCACLLACGFGHAVQAQTTAAAPTPALATSLPLAVYKGNSYAGRSGVPAFEAFMGRRVDLVADFIDFGSDKAFDNDVQWTAAGWKGYDRPLILAVPVLCRGDTFADIVAGKRDASYVKLAQTFNAAGVKIAAIRLGWEDNAQTTPGYASQDGAAKFANYKAARRHLYNLLKPLLPGTLILQDVAFGWQQVQLTQIWDPASADGLGLTVYPQTWSSSTTEPAFTQNLLHESWGLTGFGTWPPNVPIYITEYGAGGTRSDGHGAPNAGDDPTWTAATTKLFASWGSRVRGVVVWDFHAGDFNGLVSGGGFPQSGAGLKAAFARQSAVQALATNLTAKVTTGTGTVAIQPNADGSATLALNFPTGGHHVVSLSEIRPLGWGPKSVWFTNSAFSWDSAGAGTVWVGSK